MNKAPHPQEKTELTRSFTYAFYAICILSVVPFSVAAFSLSGRFKNEEALLWFLVGLAMLVLPLVARIKVGDFELVLRRISSISESMQELAAKMTKLAPRRFANLVYLISPDALPDLPPEAEEGDADAVFVADCGDRFTYEGLNRAFRALHQGAALLAGHKNRYWIKDGLPTVDAGGIVAALEYCGEVEAEIVGKPSPHFFRAAVEGLLPEGGDCRSVVMLGDRWESDVEGARAAGFQGLLVRTGLYHPGDESKGNPDGVIASVADLPDWLGL